MLFFNLSSIIISNRIKAVNELAVDNFLNQALGSSGK